MSLLTPALPYKHPEGNHAELYSFVSTFAKLQTFSPVKKNISKEGKTTMLFTLECLQLSQILSRELIHTQNKSKPK